MRIRLCSGVLVTSLLAAPQQPVNVKTMHATAAEERTKAQLERVLKAFDVKKWTFTHAIVIDEQSLPHSHPVLSLNTDYESNDVRLLGDFVHEQVHWLLVERNKATEDAKRELRALYPNAPKEPPEGAQNEESTYLHLLVCHLEYAGLRELVGEEQARKQMEFYATHHYKWVYRTILAEREKIERIVRKYQLAP
jgi:hypothetical protein